MHARLVTVGLVVFCALSAFAADLPRVTVTIDPRIELMSVVQAVDGYMLTTQYDFSYKTDVLGYFERYRNAEAFGLFARMSEAGFAFDAVPKAILTLSDPPALASISAVPPEVVERAGGREKLDAFFAALRILAEKSDFEVFLRAHRASLDQIVAQTRPEAEKAVAVLADYTGIAPPHSLVILGPLLHHGGFAAVLNADGNPTPVAIIGPVGAEDGRPSFGSADRIGSILWHEFGHTVINPLTSAEHERVARLALLYDEIAPRMKEQAYTDWETTLNEHLVRAVVVRLTFLRSGPEAGEKALAKEEARGFAYVRPLVDQLKRYEQHRDVYPTLKEFYPHLLDVLDAIRMNH